MQGLQPFFSGRVLPSTWDTIY